MDSETLIEQSTSSDETIADYLSALVRDKNNLVTNLQNKGVEVTGNETFTELVPKVASIPSIRKVLVEFYDHDGTLLYDYTKEEALALEELPAGPTNHEGLSFDEWNWTLEEIKSYLNLYPDTEVIVGANYTTVDGKTRLYITLPKDKLEIAMYFRRYGGGTASCIVDWGDGTTPETHTNLETFNYAHTYPAPGSYVIVLEVLEGKYQFSCGYRGKPICFIKSPKYSQTDSTYAGIASAKVYFDCITKIELGENVIIDGSTDCSFFGSSAGYSPILEDVIFHASNFVSSNRTGGLFSWSIGHKAIIIPRTILNITYGIRGSDFDIVSFPGNLQRFTYDSSNYSFRLGSVKKITFPDSLLELCYLPESPYITRVVLPRNLTWSSTQTLVPKNIVELDVYADFSLTNSPIFGYPLRFDTSSLLGPRAFKLTYHNDPTQVTCCGGSAFSGLDLDHFTSNIDIRNFTECKMGSVFAYTYGTELDLTNIMSYSSLDSLFSNSKVTRIIMNKNATVPSGTNSMFSSCSNLAELQLSDNITALSSGYTFSSASSLEYIKMPAKITALSSGSWYSMHSLKVLDFRDSSSVCTLTGSFSASSYPVLTYIVVPDALYDEWIAAANWSTVAAKCIKVSDYDAL